MPGRLAIYDDTTFKEDTLSTLGGFRKDNIVTLNKRYNIAPTINIPVLLDNGIYTYAHFGLITSWAKDRSSMNINARAETVYEKKSFKDSFKSKRAIIPINGYYEWKKDPLTNQSIPYMIKPSDDTYFALAALWDIWYDKENEKNILSCALITTEPNDTIEPIHDRMPVILDKKDFRTWISEDSSLETLNELLKPCQNNRIKIVEVSPLVNSVKNDSIECLDISKRVSMEQPSLF